MLKFRYRQKKSGGFAQREAAGGVHVPFGNSALATLGGTLIRSVCSSSATWRELFGHHPAPTAAG